MQIVQPVFNACTCLVLTSVPISRWSLATASSTLKAIPQAGAQLICTCLNEYGKRKIFTSGFPSAQVANSVRIDME